MNDPVDLDAVAEKVVAAALYDEGVDWKDFFPEIVDVEDHEQVALLWHQLRRIATAVNGLVKSVDQDLAPMLREHGSVSFGDVLIYGKQKRKEVCIDTLAFEGWLAENPSLAASLFNPNQVRIGQLPPAARSTFFETKVEDKIETVEVSKEFIR